MEKLAKNYEIKKGNGVKVSTLSNGYTCQRGFKFDNAEAQKKSDEVKKHLKALGLNDEEDEENSNEDGNNNNDNNNNNNNSMYSTPSSLPKPKKKEEDDDNSIRKIETMSATDNAASITNQAIQQILKDKKFQNINGVNEESLQRIKELTNLLQIKGKLLQQKSGEAQTRWETEVEINDYPQSLRWKVTQKEAVAEIMQLTETSILVKGAFIQIGRKPPQGDRKSVV